MLREVGSPSIAQYHDPYRQNRIAYGILRRLYRRADRIITLTMRAAFSGSRLLTLTSTT